MKRLSPILALCLLFACGCAVAEERLKLDKTTILGNRELPKVTFVVPWGDAAADIPDWQATPATRPTAAPLDDEFYRRQLEYLRQLHRSKNDNAAQ